MALVRQRVEEKISSGVSEKISVMFGGWCNAGTHYKTIFFTYPTQDAAGSASNCVAFTPLENEDDQTAYEHVQLFECVLGLYNKSISNVGALISDNCAVNKDVARQIGCQFISCASH